MKQFLVLLVAATLSTQAAQIQFALSPPGTDAAVGLSSSNEVPVVTNSTGSGNTIAGGIVFDTDTSTLNVNVGYGSAAGFTDLTGEATHMHIHCCAGPGVAAGVLVDVMPLNHPAGNPATGGTISGAVSIPTNSVAALLSGMTYLNIHTALNPGGEIRGQLIALLATNTPPSIACAADSTVECGTSSSVSATVADADSDTLTVVWMLNGVSVQTNTVAGSSSSAGTNVTYTAVLPLGTNVLAVTAFDSAGNSAGCASTITVVDTTPPVIHSVTADPETLWPPNHKMKSIRVQAVVTDTCGPATWKIISVTSNEAADAKGNGHTTVDWKITGDHTLTLRAERSGSGSGRVYTITIQATDLSGNTAQATVTVTVPHDQGKKPKTPKTPKPPVTPPPPGHPGHGHKH